MNNTSVGENSRLQVWPCGIGDHCQEELASCQPRCSARFGQGFSKAIFKVFIQAFSQVFFSFPGSSLGHIITLNGSGE